MRSKTYIIVILILSLCLPLTARAVERTFPAGSLVIPMDTFYQPEADGGILEAYGVIYSLLGYVDADGEHQVTIYWAINQDKTTIDGNDVVIEDLTLEAGEAVAKLYDHAGGTSELTYREGDNHLKVSYLGAPFGFSFSHFQNLYAIVILMVLIVGLLAGSYPAWFMSRFHPADIMNKRAVKSTARVSFRNVLVVLQFAITIILIVGTIVIHQQIDYMKNTDLGFDKEDVVLAYFPFTNPMAKEKYPVLKTEFLKHRNVVEVTGVYTVPGINSQYNMTVKKMGGDEGDSVSIQALPADFFIGRIHLLIVEKELLVIGMQLDPLETFRSYPGDIF